MKIFSSSPIKKPRWPWPSMNVEEVAGRAFDNNIYMPNIGYINIGNLGEWDADLGNAANSKKLWINSLVSAHACLNFSEESSNDSYYTQAIKLLLSYLRQYDSNQGLFDVAWKDEHAVSNRLFVLTAFIHKSCLKSENQLSQVELLYHAERHANWLANDTHYVKNNHGVMMDLALAQYAILIKDIDNNTSNFYLSVASARLDMMLDDTFDSKGCCTENSSTYHFVNYSLFSSIYSFFNEYDLEVGVEKWRTVLDNAKKVGALLLRPDGTVPLIGDSESKIGTFFPDVDQELSSGVGYYPEAGFFIFSSKDVHFTFRAGGAKYSHRHIDDLSVTLWVKGKDFVVDGGLYSYDIGDKVRRHFISTRSHSGIYLESAGDVRFANFNKPSDMSTFVDYDGNERGFKVGAVHNLSVEAEVFREVFYDGECFLFSDRFQSQSAQSWRYQLLLHPDVELEPLKDCNGFLLKNGSEVIKWSLSDGEYEVRVEPAYYSPKFLDKQETKVILVKGIDNSLKISTKLSLCSTS